MERISRPVLSARERALLTHLCRCRGPHTFTRHAAPDVFDAELVPLLRSLEQRRLLLINASSRRRGTTADGSVQYRFLTVELTYAGRQAVQVTPAADPPSVREARLRPECAWRYPRLSRNVWYVAASIVRVVGSRLPQADFEFRGQGPDRPPGARTRSTDGGSSRRVFRS